MRNYDFDFAAEEGAAQREQPYRISKPAFPDEELHAAVRVRLRAHAVAQFPRFTTLSMLRNRRDIRDTSCMIPSMRLQTGERWCW